MDADDSTKRKFIDVKWSNPLHALGQEVLAREIVTSVGGYINLALKSAKSSNKVLAADIIASSARSKQIVDFGGLHVEDAAISQLDLEGAIISNVILTSCTIEELVLPADVPIGLAINDSLITKVSGVSSTAGLPSWLSDNSVEEFDSVRTMSRIRDAGLGSSHEVLVVVLKKTFFQPGTGRKEEALLRGFEAGRHNKVARRVISALVAEDFLGTFKGKEGIVYTPNRAMTSRAKRMLDELKASQDPMWISVGTL
ncbi:hypothetical protein E5673_01235 [Sphingomonas sp. PAMC26645]|uniref:hypothetical protein n=1 Tax=Sphingomonas sp. PAMC26645 TaxID=2565555 RepID=UPI00109E11AA|nr:hypothetical protein [Sphingomonas sp. PAMC26645]QCB41019.1 hypothetical protein E5673_01235 [Sphingomonas sp. PAMC26645]